MLTIQWIYGKIQTNRDQKSNFLFLQPHGQSQKFQIKVVKNRQKILQRHWYLLYWIITNKKIGNCKNIPSVNLSYLLVNHASGYIEEKNENKYLIFDDSVNENKGLLKKYVDVWDGIKREIKNGGKENDYGKNHMKIIFNSGDDLP